MFSRKKNTKKDRSNETPEQKQKRIKTSLLLSAGRLLKNTDNILQSCHALFSGNLFPTDITETEKAALKESLIVLANRKKETEQVRSLLGAISPEQKKKIKAQKKNIHQEYRKALRTIDEQIKNELDPVKDEKKQLSQELKRLKEEYEKKRHEMLDRKKELTQKRKELEKNKKLKHTAAAHARSNAISEIEETQAPEIDSAHLTSAERIIERIKTDINRVKGNLMAIYASEEQEEKMNAILHGELHIPQKIQVPESPQSPQQDIGAEAKSEEKEQNPKPISSEGSIPLPTEQNQNTISEGEANINHHNEVSP